MNFAILLLSLAEVILGVILPAYGTLSLLHTGAKPNSEEYKKWGVYWILYVFLKKGVFAVLSLLPSFLSGIFLLLRVTIIAYLVLPQINGSLFVWNNYLNNKDIWDSVKGFIKKVLSTKAQ